MNGVTDRRTAACALLALLALAALSEEADARRRAAPHRNQIRIEYVAPKNPAHQAIHERLRQNRALEQLQEVLSPLRLKTTLTLKTEGCDGAANAWYEEKSVKVCYEYIEELERNAPQQTTPEGITRQDAIVGPLIEVFLHEAGHAVFDILNVPILGREEDAADQFAAYMLLLLGKEDARRAIGGVAWMYAREALRDNPMLKDFAGVHGTPAQRFFNLLCMAYGAHPDLFADVVEKGALPSSRAETCAEEYQQVSHAVERLIGPHLDPRLRARVRASLRTKQFFRPEE